MGIDVYASWAGMSDVEEKTRNASVFDVTQGNRGYLREAYHGKPYATRVLVPEAFENANVGEAVAIPAALLRSRLDATLATARERQLLVYDAGPESHDTKAVCRSFRAFVKLCESMEAKTGKPCRIYASY